MTWEAQSLRLTLRASGRSVSIVVLPLFFCSSSIFLKACRGAVCGSGGITVVYAPPEWIKIDQRETWRDAKGPLSGQELKAGDVFSFGLTMLSTLRGNHALLGS